MRDSFSIQWSEKRCKQTLLKVINPKRSLSESIIGTNIPIRGWLRGNQFYIYKRPNYKNIFFPMYIGTIVEKGEDVTQIQGKIKYPLPSILLSIFFFGIGLCFITYHLIESNGDSGVSINKFLSTDPSQWLIILLSFSIGIILIITGVIMYYYQGPFLISYVRNLFLDSI
jgi:hypothetical protein